MQVTRGRGLPLTQPGPGRQFGSASVQQHPRGLALAESLRSVAGPARVPSISFIPDSFPVGSTPADSTSFWHQHRVVNNLLMLRGEDESLKRRGQERHPANCRVAFQRGLFCRSVHDRAVAGGYFPVLLLLLPCSVEATAPVCSLSRTWSLRCLSKSNMPFSDPARGVEGGVADPAGVPVVLDEAEDRGLLGLGVVDVVDLAVGRDDQQRLARAGAAAVRVAAGHRAPLAGGAVGGLAVGVDGGVLGAVAWPVASTWSYQPSESS